MGEAGAVEALLFQALPEENQALLAKEKHACANYQIIDTGRHLTTADQVELQIVYSGNKDRNNGTVRVRWTDGYGGEGGSVLLMYLLEYPQPTGFDKASYDEASRELRVRFVQRDEGEFEYVVRIVKPAGSVAELRKFNHPTTVHR